MAEISFAQQVATFNGVLQEIEDRVARGEVGREAVADFKSSVDELRLRLWSVLSTAGASSMPWKPARSIGATRSSDRSGRPLGASAEGFTRSRGSASAHSPGLGR